MAQNITEQVKGFLDNDFIVRKCLFKNIVSLRALARHIIQKVGLKDGNLDAVISAIRRYKREEKDESDTMLKRIFQKLKVTTRSSIIDVQVQKTRKNLENISQLNSIIGIEKGEIIRVIQAEQSITMIIDDKNLDKFNEIFSKEGYISITKNLVEVNLQFSEEAQDIKGIVSIVSSSLNAEGINIVEIMSSAPELLIMIKKEDLVKVFNVLDNLQKMV
ncbi:MAG: hypothetical protein AABX34_04295 [Nanoarchaeota archaeon]